jgi:hypothetical protein
MNKLILAVVLGVLAPCSSAFGQALSQQAAVALAEKFVAANGYTDAPHNQLKKQPNFESIEFSASQGEMMQHRYNTLRPKAIGAKRGRKGGEAGWSVAFDYMPRVAADQDSCRVVTMGLDGSNIRIEHVDGVRSYFAGFN